MSGVESRSDEQTEYKVSVTYVEIYMEKIRDLLDGTNTKTNLDIRVDLQVCERVTNQEPKLSHSFALRSYKTTKMPIEATK